MLHTFLIGVSSNLSQQKSPTVKIIGLYFLGTIVPIKYMPTISAFGLFCCNKFEETPNKKVFDLTKLTKPYFTNFRATIVYLSTPSDQGASDSNAVWK